MGKFNRPTLKKYDTQEIANRTLDDSLGLEKVMIYGWTGSAAVAIKVDATGVVQGGP